MIFDLAGKGKKECYQILTCLIICTLLPALSGGLWVIAACQCVRLLLTELTSMKLVING